MRGTLFRQISVTLVPFDPATKFGGEQLCKGQASLPNTLYTTTFQNLKQIVFKLFLSGAVVKAPKFCHVTPILKPLHWLKLNERIQ